MQILFINIYYSCMICMFYISSVRGVCRRFCKLGISSSEIFYKADLSN